MRFRFWGFLILGLAWGMSHGDAQEGYLAHGQLTAALRQLAEAHPHRARLRELAKSAEGREVWLLELGTGEEAERARRPAMLLVAGAEGNDLASSLTAMTWTKQLLAEEERAQKLLAETTFYIVPRLSVDAAEGYFRQPQIESTTNGQPVDDDHDGLLDEDGPDDLNADGKITWMRVADPAGEWIPHPDEPRVMIKADALKGERGQWRVLREGKDDDQDESWNEDGRGGVNPNRNFPYEYAWFAADAGAHQLSEATAKALADFFIGHGHIAAAFTFGAADNLLGPPKARDGDEANKPATGLHKDDLAIFQDWGKRYRDGLGLGEQGARSVPGSLAEWVYFHRGRFSFGARAWTPAMAVELAKKAADENKKEAKPEEKKDEPAKKEPDKRAEAERAFLGWIDQQQPSWFTAWQDFSHPDFPGKKVEIGGLGPFAESTPPLSLATDLAKKQADFLTTLAEKLPRIAIREATLKPLGNNVHELTVTIENRGHLPTMPRHGEITREVMPTWLTVDLPEASFLAGERNRTRVPTLKGQGGAAEFRYVLHLVDRKEFALRVVSAIAGSVEAKIKAGQ